jgi:hypothetical protein
MIEQILPNNNEKCYKNFLPKFLDLNTALDEKLYPNKDTTMKFM